MYPPVVFDKVFRLCEERGAFLSAVERLTGIFCHHDAPRRKLFARCPADGEYEIVSTDRAQAGTGVVGGEPRYPIATRMWFFQVEVEVLAQPDGIVSDGDVRGLRDPDWRGDDRLARLGYTVLTVLENLPSASATPISTDGNRYAKWERAVGHFIEQLAENLVRTTNFVLEPEEEARQLMGSLL
jgi:hypothetical protein